MDDGNQDTWCRWSVEGRECGKPAVGQADAVGIALREPVVCPIGVCQEHLDESRRLAASSDAG
jgi:hypothetical protein